MGLHSSFTAHLSSSLFTLHSHHISPPPYYQFTNPLVSLFTLPLPPYKPTVYEPACGKKPLQAAARAYFSLGARRGAPSSSDGSGCGARPRLVRETERQRARPRLVRGTSGRRGHKAGHHESDRTVGPRGPPAHLFVPAALPVARARPHARPTAAPPDRTQGMLCQM